MPLQDGMISLKVKSFSRSLNNYQITVDVVLKS